MGKRLFGATLAVLAAGVGFYQWLFYVSNTVIIKPSPGVGPLFWVSLALTAMLAVAALWLLLSSRS